MRSLKSQQALVQTAPTQFGPAAALGVSIGCGFRLSDPRILLHEASVWQAFMAAPLTTPIMELALPKHSAEWLLGGHAACMAEARQAHRVTDWEASVSLDGVKKSIHCTARVMPWTDAHDGTVQHRARLAIDYPHAMKDIRGRQNPVGTSVPGSLQLMGKLGPIGHPLAAMGPIEARWASRADLAPSRSSVRDPFGRDGSHMGWPAQMDLRYFQLAPADQQRQGQGWTPGAAFELRGFGPQGQGFRGHLPAIEPQVMVQRRAQQALEPVSLTPQTVWFLPDHDTGVIWWHGMVPIDGVLSDEIALGIIALREQGRLLPTPQLAQIVAERSSLDLSSTASLRDSDLMPERSRGWIWDLILGAQDHPSLRAAPLAYATLQSRVDTFEATLAEAQRNGERAAALGAEAASVPWAHVQALQAHDALSDADARAAFIVPPGGVLSDRRFRAARLSGLHVYDLHVTRVRFVRTDLERSAWRNCQFEDCEFEDCDLTRSQWQGCSFVRCRFTRSALGHASFSHCDQRHGHLDLCNVAHSRFAGGRWTQMSLQRLSGEHLGMEGVRLDSASWLQCQLPDSLLSDLVLVNSSVVDCRLAASTLRRCVLERFGVIGTDLRASVWQECKCIAVNFAKETDLGQAQISDCAFDNSSWVDVRADGIRVIDTAFRPLTAPRLHAPNSAWLNTVLTDANLMHADLSASTVRATSLKDANVYGADLRDATFKNCNLIRLQSAWTHGPQSLDGGGNLTARIQSIPRRPR